MKHWKLSFTTFQGGRTYYFYTLGGAIKYLKSTIYKDCFVDLENKKLDINIRLYVPDEKYNWTLGLKFNRK